MQIPFELNRKYAVVDLETTGLDCWSDLIIEIGLMVVSDGKVTGPDSVLVKIDQPLPQEITDLTGITSQLVSQEGITIDEALAWFCQKIGDLPLVGHNVIRFDRAFLLEAARQHRRAVAPERRVLDEVDDLPAFRFLDTMALFKGHKLGLKPSPNESHYQYAQRVLETPAQGLRFNLTAACNDLGIVTSGTARHRASGDVTLTQQLFEKLLQVQPPEAFMLGGKYAI